ncbi:MAG: cysteine desulfurase, partial [Rhodobacteraceae bacterium]
MKGYDIVIVSDIRKDFPILEKKIHGNSLVYFDNGASAQKPEKVIEVIKSCYLNEYSNVHRGLHYLSNNLTDKFEAVREKIQVYLGARDPSEIIFTSGSTESLNLVAYSWGANNLREGDEIILSVMEHHSNIVPWHFLREKIGIKIIWADINTKGILEIDEVIKKISPKTKLISVTHMSNVLGSKVDIKSLCRYTRSKGIVVAVDGSQGCVHQKVDVSDLDCDFYAITGHKLYGPSGSGALYVKQDKFDQMSPFMGGGEMIESVTKESVIYADPPQ